MVSFSTLTLAAASVATLGSASSIFLGTGRFFNNDGKVAVVYDTVQAFEKETSGPCSDDKRVADCDTQPMGKKVVTCTAKYNGTKPWTDIVGSFQNISGPVVDHGSLRIDRKNGMPPLTLNVTNDSRCKKLTCTISSNDTKARLENTGFKCIV